MGSDREMENVGAGWAEGSTCGPPGACVQSVGSLQPWGRLQVWSRAGEHGKAGMEAAEYKGRVPTRGWVRIRWCRSGRKKQTDAGSARDVQGEDNAWDWRCDSLHRQPVWIWSLLDSTPLGVSVGAFLEKFSGGGKTHPAAPCYGLGALN